MEIDYFFGIEVLIKKAVNFEKSSTKNNAFGKQNKLGIFGFLRCMEFFKEGFTFFIGDNQNKRFDPLISIL